MDLLSRTEEILLLVIWRLRDEAYGVSIRDEAGRATGQEWSLGAVYAPLHRMEKKGLVETRHGEPTAERGGRSKVYYELTARGREALLEVRRVHDTLWSTRPAMGRAGRAT